MAEEKKKQSEVQLNEEQLDEVSGGVMRIGWDDDVPNTILPHTT